MPKILISDFDKTLFTSDEELTNNINRITQFINNGNIFVIATGRSYTDIKDLISKYNIPLSDLICNDGGIIFDKSGNIIYRKDIPFSTVKKIYNYLSNNNLLSDSYFDTGLSHTNIPSNIVNTIIIKADNKNNSTKLLNYLTNNYDNIHGYISNNWININKKTNTKASGIEELSKIYGYNKNDIYTIGDTINDIEMIENYNGACMENSSDNLKSICSKTFKSVRDYIDYIERG